MTSHSIIMEFYILVKTHPIGTPHASTLGQGAHEYWDSSRINIGTKNQTNARIRLS